MRAGRIVLPALLSACLLGGCATSGVEAAVESDAFTSCLDATEASPDGAADWDTREQLEFWGRHGTLVCAVDELDDDQLDDALEDAFADPADADDRTDVANGQALAVRTLATDVTASRGEDAAVQAVAAVVRAGWYHNDDDSLAVRRLGAFTILAVSGETPGYAGFRQRNAESNYDDIELDLLYAGDVWDHDAESEQVADRLVALTEDIGDEV